MMNNNHKNSGCGFAEELVSYLYGETDAAANAKFEAHLESCSDCADELEAFSGVHFSINDWKSTEFNVLETPAIEIPYATAPKTQAVSSVSSSWLSALRDLFSLSPRGWSLATASLAVLAVIGGIVLFGLNSRTASDLAEANNKVLPTAVATVEKTPEPANVTKNNNAPDRESKPLKEPNSPQSELAVETKSKNNRAVKASNNQSKKPDNTNSTKNGDGKRSNKNEKEIATPVIPDEEEDDTLRLAELFEEIDTKE